MKRLARAFPARSGARRFHTLHKLLTMSSADFLDEWFETEALKATKSASGIIGTLLGPRSPGTAYVLLHHYMGELDGVFRAWGFAKGGNGSVSAAIAARGAAPRVPRSAPQRRFRKVLVRGRHARGASCWRRRGDPREAGRLGRRSAAHVPAARRREAPARRLRRRDPALPLPRLLGQGEPGARRAAGLHLPARARAAPARRDLDQPERRLPRARLRRREVRRGLAPAVHGHRDPVDDRSVDGAAGQARDVDLRAVRAVPRERRLDRRAARGVRRRGGRHARRSTRRT